jgi:hypothetical protein
MAADPLGEPCGVRCIALRQDDDELFAADTGDDVGGPGVLAQGGREADEDAVAGLMPGRFAALSRARPRCARRTRAG